MEHLIDKLEQYSQSDFYPYHMPGHKRQSEWENLKELYKLDITEIEGFDNLHDAQGILASIQEMTARSFHAEESFLLVNGSTCGILAAISAAVPKGGHLLIARNCHKSVYHGAYLREAQLHYIFPAIREDYDIYQAVRADEVEQALRQYENIDAVLITSPTYEGMIADIRQIAKKVHEYGAVLIVDEAHGAHLGIEGISQDNSCVLGADLVIHSLHKTLPAMTQTAVLHVNGRRVDRELLRRFLGIYQSSSPSYVLMASMEQAVLSREKIGEGQGQKFLALRGQFLEKIKECRYIRVFETDDICKLLVSVKGTTMSGEQLYERLLWEYHLQMEMVSATFVLAIVTFADTEEGFARLLAALLSIDKSLEKEEAHFYIPLLPKPERSYELREAWDKTGEWIGLEESKGQACGEFVFLYPPGVPILVPGERIGESELSLLNYYIRCGLSVKGLRKIQNQYEIKIIT